MFVFSLFTDIHFAIGAFGVIWLSAWISNGSLNTHFDLISLRDIFVFIMSKYGFDSVFNSNKGEKI